ncbi:hypothetical protein PL10110_200059 [Planktothrix agardhii]|nr:hypothetical protein PL10110_200059 [Planktothrix agardhii]
MARNLFTIINIRGDTSCRNWPWKRPYRLNETDLSRNSVKKHLTTVVAVVAVVALQRNLTTVVALQRNLTTVVALQRNLTTVVALQRNLTTVVALQRNLKSLNNDNERKYTKVRCCTLEPLRLR